MGNKSTKSSRNVPVEKPSNQEVFQIPKLKFIFYWRSNLDPFNSYEIPSWDPYDLNNLNYLNLKYTEFIQDPNNYCVTLLHPLNNYEIDFLDMLQRHRTEKRSRPIKVEECIEEKKEDLKEEIAYESHNDSESESEKDFLFFWKANIEPWEIKELPNWAPYDQEDQYILSQAYNTFLIDQTQNKVDLKKPADHFIDLSQMMQFNKIDSYKCRQIQRSFPGQIKNIVRINRFNTKAKNYQYNIDFMGEKVLNQYDYSFFFRNIEQQKKKKFNKIYFCVFPENPCELELEESLSFFDDNSIIQISLEDLKLNLIQEMNTISKEGEKNQKIHSALNYKLEIEKIKDLKSFCKQIVHIYTMEGFLYKKLNHFLRKLDQKEFQNIKYYYISLLSCFKYINQNTQINMNQNLIVYRASRCSDEEFKKYEVNNNSKIIRVFKEFLSTSSDHLVSMNLFKKNDPNFKEFLWEISIPSEIIKYESSYFADISKYSQYPSEKELLIRSGAVIQIDKIVPYTEVINNQIIEYKNKFKKICTLKSFSLVSLFQMVVLDPSIEKLYLHENNLGENENNMLYLKEALENNRTIKVINLNMNNLGCNEKNMIYLKEALEKNDSIQELFLGSNNLGRNVKNMLYLKIALLKNNSIEDLNLWNNNLGINEMNLAHLKDILENNMSIRKIGLGGNKLGRNEKNMNFMKEALEKNNSLVELDLYDNNLRENQKNMLYLKQALEINRSIKKVDLRSNYLGFTEFQMFKNFTNIKILFD